MKFLPVEDVFSVATMYYSSWFVSVRRQYYVLSSWFVSLSTSTTEETETERAEGEERKRMGDGRQDAVESK